MTVTILVILSSVCAVLIGGIVLITATFSRSLQKALDHADRVHERGAQMLSEAHDRLMARTLEDFKVYDLGDRAHGEVSYPENGGADRPWNVPGQFSPRAGLAGGTKEVGRVEGNDEE